MSLPNGALPKYILGYGIMNLISGVSSFTNPTSIHALFNGITGPHSTAMTGLLARTFGTLNLVSAIFRLTTAYNMRNQQLYVASMASFAMTSVIYTLEGFYWNTGVSTMGYVRVGAMALAAVWMFAEWGNY